MKSLIINVLFIIGFVSSISAQTSLSANDLNPNPGDVYVLNNVGSAPFVSPGDTGVNVTWDLSMLNFPQRDTIVFIACDNTPACGYFPAGNIAQLSHSYSNNVRHDTYNYLDANADSLSALGAIDINQATDTEVYAGCKLLQYPISYGSHSSGDFIMDYWSSFDVSHYVGNQTVICDGYGTLITPADTFRQVFRIHTMKDEIDTDKFTTDTFVYHRVLDSYSWYAASYHFALATVQIFSDSAYFSHNKTTDYETNYAVKQPSLAVNTVQSILARVDLYPNPAKDVLNVKFAITAKQDVSVIIQDLLGRQVAIISSGSYNAGEHTLRFNTSQLSKGVYILRLQADGLNTTRKFELY